MKLSMSDPLPVPGDARTVGQALLEPTRIYAKATAALTQHLEGDLRAMAHITGGGLPENLPRVLPEGLGAELDLGSFERPALFRLIAEGGPVEEAELLRTFNCGVGLCVVVAPGAVSRAIALLEGAGERAWPLGRIDRVSGAERVTFKRPSA